MSEKMILKASAIAGVIALLSNIMNVPVGGYATVSTGEVTQTTAGFAGFVTGLLIGTGAYVLYVYGFAVLGRRFKSDVLLYSAYVLIGIYIVGFLVTLLSRDAGTYAAVLQIVGEILGFGMTVSMLGVGYSILRHQKHLGPVGTWYGILELLSATGVAFIISSFVGYGLDTVLYLLGAALLWREATRGKKTVAKA